ncbi:MAG TPA: PAS domain S-box protein, partial [Anaerolineales bacterium]|nr:PAS domain S-box protein [Anaerolineales bacterium]
IYGYTEAEAVGKPISMLVPPELPDEENNILETLKSGDRIEHFETVRVTKTGKRIHVSLSISPIKDSTGKIVGCAGTARDITNRKRAEEALLSSERRYRLLFERNVAGVGIASLDGRLLDCNDGWARILGYQSKDELRGRHASEFYFNPAERQSLVDELFEKQVLFSRELQLKRKDGTPVWVLFNAAVHSDHDRPILQATMIDISEWKRADEALSGMTRKLIESQEQERARIGRELHDDINQRLAMLSVEVEQLRETPSEIENRVREFQKRISEISSDVQGLSHDLHSSKLEYLGVVAGIKSWCKEFGERQRVELDFNNDVNSVLPFEIGLSLFRVLQEALHNATKHSGVKRIEVQLREDSGEIHLMIRDSGRGFDVDAALQGKGLGLTSMRERVRLVNGTISIESKPMGGTT